MRYFKTPAFLTYILIFLWCVVLYIRQHISRWRTRIMERKRLSATELYQQQAAAKAALPPRERRLEDEDETFADLELPEAPVAAAAVAAPKGMKPMKPQSADVMPSSTLVTSEQLQLEKDPIRVRETGYWFWKRVIVPPNAYVVHTRIGHAEPITLGLGCSFRYNPYRDAYLVVPAAMQTIGVVANSITREKQGINVLAYLQWQIDDFAVAYRRLDFSDSHDPLGIVNAQLREQAEAAIKDKIATMSVEDVLTDKAPIIEELTTRLKAVTEGLGADQQDGLGIKIVTVQLREAMVSSQQLWQDLQAPFRHQQEKMARISYLQMQNEVKQKELESKELHETRSAESNLVIEKVRQNKQTEIITLKLSEEAQRFSKEQQSRQQQIKQQEETTLAEQLSEQKTQAHAHDIAQQQQLAQMQQQHEQSLTKARLQSEQQLQALTETLRLSEQELQTALKQLENDRILQAAKATYQQQQQQHDDALSAQAQAATLQRQQAETEMQVQLEEMQYVLQLKQQQEAIELEKRQQMIRNMTNEVDLVRRLIETAPEMIAALPDIDELKIWQTGQEDAAWQAVGSWLQKSIAVAKELGVQLPVHQQGHE